MWTCFFFSLPAACGQSVWVCVVGHTVRVPQASGIFFFFLWSIVCSLEPSVLSAASSTLWRMVAPLAGRFAPFYGAAPIIQHSQRSLGRGGGRKKKKKKNNVTNNLSLRQHYASHVLPWLAANSKKFLHMTLPLPSPRQYILAFTYTA